MGWKDYDCPACGKNGYIIENGMVRMCKCLVKRNSMRRLEESGLQKSVDRCTFDNYEVNEPWQQRMRDIALKYVETGASCGCWLYLGGQSGTGKTHLATAVLGKLAETDDIRYMPWTIGVQGIKCVITDDVKYNERIKPLQEVRTLYIDDFFKPVRGRDGLQQTATPSDIRIAFDILNYRYVNDLPTIISSEWHIRELDGIDEAVSSRIFEKCGEYKVNVKRESNRNYRYRNDTII